MTLAELIYNPLLPRAVVVGAFGAAGLMLTSIHSNRGPLIYPVYAALLAALTILAGRYSELPFGVRFAAVLVSFIVSSTGLAVVSDILARRGRARLVAQGRIPANARHYRVSPAGYAARAGILLMIGALVSAAVAFVAV